MKIITGRFSFSALLFLMAMLNIALSVSCTSAATVLRSETDYARPDDAHPDEVRPDETSPDAERPDEFRQDTERSIIRRPDTVRPDSMRPDARHNTPRPDAVRPDASRHETVRLDSARIESERLEAERLNAQRLNAALSAAELPESLAAKIRASKGFFFALNNALQTGDPFLFKLVDKNHPLPEDYEPADLVELHYQSYRAGIADAMFLREKAEAALEEMAAEARREGVHLVVSSAYRSYQYQIGSFARWTKRLRLDGAERVSARPGKSQHQLGLVVDFGSISNDWAETRAGRWVAANAARFGWSLSYPRGYEEVTGYDWECWHFRFVGRELAAFIDDWFGGIQQYALRFIHEWENAAP